MARKFVTNSKNQTITTDAAERMSNQFDQKWDVRDTFTVRLLSSITGKSDDAVRTAIMLAMKKSNSRSANIKIRFTREYAMNNLERIVNLAKKIQLENEAIIMELRENLSEEDKRNGKKIAMQNYAKMKAKEQLSSTVSNDSIDVALKNTGKWFTPESAVFTSCVDFVGLSPEDTGIAIEKEIPVVDSEGNSSMAYRVIAELGGAKSCPVTVKNKNTMADILYNNLSLFHEVFNNVDGSDMDQLLNALEEFTDKYRRHDNSELVDTRLLEDEKDEAEAWALRAITWLQEN